MAAPPCPRDASDGRRSAVELDEATSKYFRHHWRPARFRSPDETSGEGSLPDVPGVTAYRYIRTGTFSDIVVVARRAYDVVAEETRWGLCEDQDFGVAPERASWVESLQTWRRIDSCMDRVFWTAEPVQRKGLETHGFVQVCGPGRHEASCVVSSNFGTELVEGFRDGRHHIVFPQYLEAFERDALEACVALMRRAAEDP